MDTTTATALADKALNNVKPSSPAEFYVLVIVSGIVVCWGLFWYLKFKFAGGQKSGGQNGDQSINQDVYRLHPEDRARLERLEESVKALADAFREIVHERGELMEKIGELRGSVNALKKSA